MSKSREQRLITKEHIATHTNLIHILLNTVVLNSRDRHENVLLPKNMCLEKQPI